MYRAALIFCFLFLSACGGCFDDRSTDWNLEESVEPDPEPAPVATPVEPTEGPTPRPEDDVCDLALAATCETYRADFPDCTHPRAVTLTFTFDDRPAGGLVDRCWLRGLNEDGRSVFSVEFTREAGIVRAGISDTPHPLHGRLMNHRADTDGDGVWDYVSRQSYDAQSRTTSVREDLDGDGTLDRTGTRTLDAAGNIIESATDDDADGAVDRRSWWTHDDLNRTTRQEGDWNADGQLDFIATYAYFGDTHNPTRYESRKFENGEELVEIGTVSYDDRGRQISSEADRDGDGTTDDRSWTNWTEDDLATRYFDFDMDGQPDGIYEEQWVEIGGERRITYLSDDWDADGVLDQERFQFYDENGRQTEFRMVVDGRVTWRQWSL